MKVIGLTGWAQVGKDTVAEYLATKGYVRIGFADALKGFALDVIPDCRKLVEDVGWEKAKRFQFVREGLQRLGQACRDHFGSGFWVKQAMQKVDQQENWNSVTGYNSNVVFSDVRYDNEATAIRSRGGEIWLVERPGHGPVNAFEGANHRVSEGLVNKKIENSGNLNDLYAQVDMALAAEEPEDAIT